MEPIRSGIGRWEAAPASGYSGRPLCYALVNHPCLGILLSICLATSRHRLGRFPLVCRYFCRYSPTNRLYRYFLSTAYIYRGVVDDEDTLEHWNIGRRRRTIYNAGYGTTTSTDSAVNAVSTDNTDGAARTVKYRQYRQYRQRRRNRQSTDSAVGTANQNRQRSTSQACTKKGLNLKRDRSWTG